MPVSLANFDLIPRLVVAILPQRYDDERLTIKKCTEIVSSCQVRARGWYFPHIGRDGINAGPQSAYISHQTELVGEHLEEWRMYRSGQFLFRMMPWEVPNEAVQRQMRSNARGWDSRSNVNDVPGFLSFVMLILSVAEAYLFASRLAQAAQYDTAVDIQIGLRGVRGWALGSNDFGVDLYDAYVSKSEIIDHKASLPLDALIADPLAAAIVATESLFEQFGWLTVAPATIEKWQRKYLR